MRARFVSENIDFERGIDPKTSMGIGDPIKVLFDRAWNIIKKTDWSETGFAGPKRSDFDKWTEDMMNYLGHNEILREEPTDLKISFEDGWEETHEEMYENVSFERTGNPKKGMGIGGVSLSRTRNEILDNARKDWVSWLEKNLVGRTVTAHMNQIQKKIPDGYEVGGEGWGDYTINVEDIVTEPMMDNNALFVHADDQWQYVIPIDDNKIYMK